MERKPNKQNLLLTHWENATLPHRVRSYYFSNALTTCVCNFQDVYVIEYKRMNHYDFKFLLKMQNPNLVKRKVIVRLWLVPTNRTSPTARYHPTTGFVVDIGYVMILANILLIDQEIHTVFLTGHTTPKKRLPLTALSTS